MSFNIWDKMIIGFACDWLDKTIIDKPISQAADDQT